MLYTYRNNEIDRKTIIECEHCKAQYLLGEIFVPGALIGQPKEVVKDSLGKIIYVDYKSESNVPTKTETFVCEYCGKPFSINAELTIKIAKEAPEKDFSTKYVSLLFD